MAETLHFHLPGPMRRDAAAGRVNIVNRIMAALPGWRAEFHRDDDGPRPGRGIWHMRTPPEGALCLRRAGWYPFWHLEATNDRWMFDVARAAFDPGGIDPEEARGFQRRWRQRLLPKDQPTSEGFLFMPLQGRLTDRRGFQAMSPVEMIEATLAQDPRPIRATLHPREVYSGSERAALERLAARHPRFRLVDAASERLLMRCDMVVTQNSSLAFTGYLLDKPAVLFAMTDCHHIAGSVPRDGPEAAFAQAREGVPEAARYLWWFLRLHTVNGGAPGAEDQVRARLARFGWPVGV